MDISEFFFKYPPLKPLKPIVVIFFFLANLISSIIFLELPEELIIIIKSFFLQKFSA